MWASSAKMGQQLGYFVEGRQYHLCHNWLIECGLHFSSRWPRLDLPLSTFVKIAKIRSSFWELLSKSPRLDLPFEYPCKIAKIRSSFGVIHSRDQSENFSYSISHIETRQEFWHLISGFKTRPRKILQSLALWRDRDLLSSFLNFAELWLELFVFLMLPLGKLKDVTFIWKHLQIQNGFSQASYSPLLRGFLPEALQSMMQRA